MPNQSINTVTDQRGQDILKLCKAVLNTNSIFFDNPNGPYENSCPFCEVTSHTGGEKTYVKMSELEHKHDCAYLIAKDLSTNLL